MYKLLGLMILLVMSTHLLAAEDKTASQDKKPEYTEEQLNKLKAAEEQFKDNPEMMNFINKIKDQSGLNQPPPAAETEGAPQKPAIQGSRSVAEEAYKNGDYETALEHYQALAAEGDADASLVLGTMYEQGLGTDKDPSLAHAWYKKAADAGDDRGLELMTLVNESELTEEGRTKAEQDYAEINKAQNDNSPAETTGNKFRVLINTDAINNGKVRYVYAEPSREVKISPEKYSPDYPHLQSVDEHYQPEKFTRDSSELN